MPHAGTATHLFQYVDQRNSTETPLNAGETFTGAWVETLQFPTTMIALTSDQNCTYKVQFSPDATNIDSTLEFRFLDEGLVETPKRIVNTRRYYRVIIENDSGVNQTFLRCQTILGHHSILNAPLNGVITQDSDAVLVRSVPIEDEIALGRYQNVELDIKFGRNPDIDTATVPEDLWGGGGVYTGFPAGSPEELQIVLAEAADVGAVITIEYLPTITSTKYVTADITTTGLSTNTGITAIRCPKATFNNGSTANTGTVTIRHITTTTNVFAVMPIGRSETQIACFTVPAQTKGVLKQIHTEISKLNPAIATGALYIKELNKSPRLIRPFSVSNNEGVFDPIYGGLVIDGFADIALRIDSCSANSVVMTGSIEYLLFNEE